MNRDEIKHSKEIMRQVQEHLLQSHTHIGAQTKKVGFMEIVHHPISSYYRFNYITPGRNTAHVSGQYIQSSIKHFEELGHSPRILFIDELYPVLFPKTLDILNFKPKYDLQIMACEIDPEQSATVNQKEEITVSHVSTHDGISQWWYVWQNAAYDVVTSGVEPLVVGREMEQIQSGNQIDLIMYRYTFPIGVVRLTKFKHSMHIVAYAMMKEVKDAHLTQTLYDHIRQQALQHKCKFIFQLAETDEQKQNCEQIGFKPSGKLMFYVQSDSEQGNLDGTLAKTILVDDDNPATSTG